MTCNTLYLAWSHIQPKEQGNKKNRVDGTRGWTKFENGAGKQAT